MRTNQKNGLVFVQTSDTCYPLPTLRPVRISMLLILTPPELFSHWKRLPRWHSEKLQIYHSGKSRNPSGTVPIVENFPLLEKNVPQTLIKLSLMRYVPKPC